MARRRLRFLYVSALILVFAVVSAGYYGWSFYHRGPVQALAVSHGYRAKTSPSASPSSTPVQASATPAPTQTALPQIGSRFGLSLGDTLQGMPSTRLANELSGIKALGVGWIRVDLDWNDIQPNNASSYHWSGFDAIVAGARARGLQVLPVVDYTPSWARPASCTSAEFCAPASPGQFAAFAAAAAARYAPRGVHNWEIWNEENQNFYWQPSANASAYVTLLKQTYAAIKHVDGSATVISGGLATTDTAAGGIAQLDYLSEMYADGAKGSFDAVGYHPYSFPVPASYFVSWNAWSKMGQTTPSLRSIMVANGDGNKQIWPTEYGAPTNGPGAVSVPNNYNINASPDHVNEAMQAVIARDFVTTAENVPWLGPAFWYTYQDAGTDASNTEDFYGLLRANGSQKPAYLAFKEALSGL